MKISLSKEHQDCVFCLQVDLVGSEKLNNSMGFSMFFVGLGCLTGPPLAGELRFLKPYKFSSTFFSVSEKTEQSFIHS